VNVRCTNNQGSRGQGVQFRGLGLGDRDMFVTSLGINIVRRCSSGISSREVDAISLFGCNLFPRCNHLRWSQGRRRQRRRRRISRISPCRTPRGFHLFFRGRRRRRYHVIAVAVAVTQGALVLSCRPGDLEFRIYNF